MCKKALVIITVLLSFTFVFCSNIENYINSISKRQIQSIIEFLSDDLLEGRAPGTNGGYLAEKYVKSIFKLLDIEPYGKDYFQQFVLKGYTLEELMVEANGVSLKFKDDVMGSYTEDVNNFSLEGEAVFAGFGIISKDWEWNDYKNVSVKDKILIIRVNEPGRNNPELFEGKALTYYGRWTYKLEEAARQGAKGVLLIHTPDTAGYGWHVVRNSWGGESLYLPFTLKSNLKFRGWIREEKLREILNKKGINIEELYKKSESRTFKPIGLGFKIKIQGKNKFRSVIVNNVVGYIPGSDPKLKEKSIVLSAHIDHLGKNPSLSGDQIFNGAIDNSSAVASMIVTAKILKEYQKNLKYSIIVLACEAEEEGLLGSYFFANSIDPSKIIANINFESTPVWEKARDFIAVGAKYSTLEDILKKILKKENLKYSYFSMANQGFFYRSDQFSFARKGIPSIWITAGEDYVSGKNRLKEFFTGNYHTPEDEYNPEWKLDSTIQTIKIALLLIDYINRNTPEIKWKGKMTFPVEN